MIVNRNGSYDLISRTGKVLGSHPTRQKAIAQEVAIEISKRKQMNKLSSVTHVASADKYLSMVFK